MVLSLQTNHPYACLQYCLFFISSEQNNEFYFLLVIFCLIHLSLWRKSVELCRKVVCGDRFWFFDVNLLGIFIFSKWDFFIFLTSSCLFNTDQFPVLGLVSLLYMLCVCALSLSIVWLFMTLWTVAHQASLSMGFSRQEYWSGFPCPPPGDLSDLGIEPVSLKSPALAGRPFITSATWEAPKQVLRPQKCWGVLCPSLQSSSGENNCAAWPLQRNCLLLSFPGILWS